MSIPGHSDSLNGQTVFMLYNAANEVVCMTQKPRKLREALEVQIHHHKMRYGAESSSMDIPTQVRTLRADWKDFSLEKTNANLKNGHIALIKMSKKGTVAFGKMEVSK